MVDAMKVKVPVGDPQTPQDYLVVRVQLVHVKKGLFGLRDRKVFSTNALIPSTRQEAVNVYNKIDGEFQKRGVRVRG